MDLDEYKIDAEIAIDRISCNAYTLDGRNMKEYVLEDAEQCLEVLNKIKDYVEDTIYNIEFEVDWIKRNKVESEE